MNARSFALIAVFIPAASLLVAAPAAKAKEKEKDTQRFTETFGEEKTDLVSTGRNPYFILEPGFVQTFQGTEDEEKVELIITILAETRTVDGVETRVVEEHETVNGKLVEVSRNYFAISKRTNSVYYFGEDSKSYKDGKVVSTEGSWESGVQGAMYGMIMPGVPLLGARYYQEVAPDVAMDRAEVVNVADTLAVPAGAFTKVLKTEETTPLEPKSKEYKYYAPGLGLIKDGALTLAKSEFQGAKTQNP